MSLDLDDIVQSFAAHDEALQTIVDKADELRRAADEMKRTRETASEELEKARQDLGPVVDAVRDSVDRLAIVVTTNGEVAAGVTTLTGALTDTTARLSEFEPEVLDARLTEISQHLATTRDRVSDIREKLAEISERLAQSNRQSEELSASVRTGFEEARSDAADLAERQRKRWLALVALVVITLGAAIASVVVSLP